MYNRRVIATAHSIGAFGLAVAFLFLGAAAAEVYRLPLIHAWALAHGAIFLVFPVYFIIAYFLLRPIARRFEQSLTEAMATNHRVSAFAIASLVLSGSGFLIPFVGSVLGIAAGHVARHRGKNDPRLTGNGFALAGLILGYLGLAYSAYVFVMGAWVAFSRGS